MYPISYIVCTLRMEVVVSFGEVQSLYCCGFRFADLVKSFDIFER